MNDADASAPVDIAWGTSSPEAWGSVPDNTTTQATADQESWQPATGGET